MARDGGDVSGAGAVERRWGAVAPVSNVRGVGAGEEHLSAVDEGGRLVESEHAEISSCAALVLLP